MLVGSPCVPCVFPGNIGQISLPFGPRTKFIIRRYVPLLSKKYGNPHGTDHARVGYFCVTIILVHLFLGRHGREAGHARRPCALGEV